MSVPEVEEINISCEAGMEESFPGASAPKNKNEKIGFRVVMEIVFNLNIYFLLMIYFQSQGSAFIVSTKGADLILMLILKWYGLFRLGTNTPLSMVIIACIILRQRFFHMKKIQGCSFDE